jgi:hypothetical protein
MDSSDNATLRTSASCIGPKGVVEALLTSK